MAIPVDVFHGFACLPREGRRGLRDRLPALLATLLPALGALVATTPAIGQVAAPARAGAAAGDPPPADVERLKLATSDGVALAAWYYPASTPDTDADKAGAGPTPIVILLHDLGGSHKTVEPLALALQAGGIAVVAPDLRGHGATVAAAGRGPADAAALKKADFDNMVATAGGQVREQATTIGDVEAVRNWIVGGPAAGKFDQKKLVVVGSGAGAAVAAYWTMMDAKWPDLASGPQGRQVRGLVLISPAWTTRGFSIAPALGVEPLQKTLPILVIAGGQDTDAVKLYDQLKKKRPDGWSEKRAGQAAKTQAAKLGDDGLPSLYLRQSDGGLSGDRLAAYVPKDPQGGGHPAAIVAGFIGAITAEDQ